MPSCAGKQINDISSFSFFHQGKYLAQFNSRTYWYINWSKFSNDTEIYGLFIKGDTDPQGMVAIQYDTEARAVHLIWGCTAPHYNIWKYGKQEYRGVGGHLIAIAAELSEKHGYDGFLYGDAADYELFQYYINRFNALPLPPDENPYRFMLSDDATAEIRSVYNYEWSEEYI